VSEPDGRVRRGHETREARRAQILESALTVFATKGYHETSVTDLVDAAGVARGTFYLYFDSKEAIFPRAGLRPAAPPAGQRGRRRPGAR
jgi:AcrR family transcriptional regulator